jgi:hypothetical protein
MSTEIKPGDEIVTVQDAPTLLGYTVPKGTRGTVKKSGPPIMGPYSVYAHFEGDTPGDGRQVRPGDVAVVPGAPSTAITLQLNDATIIRHTTDPDLSDLYDAGWVKVPTTPAPLDPTLVQAGDTVTLERGKALVRDVVIEVKSRGEGQFVIYTGESPDPLIPGTYYLVNTGAWTLTDHQPAPKKTPREQVVDILIGYSNTRADDYDTADRIIAALVPTEEQVDRVLRNYSTTITRPGTADFGALGHYTAEMMSLFGGESR